MPRFSAYGNQRMIGRVPWKHSILIALLASVTLAPGCMSLVPRTTNVVPLSNGVIEYRNPSFDNRISATGWACIAAMTAGGAYEGYRSNLKLRWTGWERKPEIQTAGNTALGAMAGLASGLLITWIVGGEAPTVTTDNAAVWLEKLDDRMILVPATMEYPGLPLKSIQAMARKTETSLIPGPGREKTYSAQLSRRDWAFKRPAWNHQENADPCYTTSPGIFSANLFVADSATGCNSSAATGGNHEE